MQQILRAISVRHSAKFGIYLVVALLASTIMPTGTGANKSDSKAENLLEKAERLTDIRSPGSSSFHLTATLKLYDDKGVATDGTYDLLWKLPTLWRDEIRLPGFSQTRVAATDRIYIMRNPRWLPLEIYNLRKLLEFPRSIRWSSDAAGRKLKEKKTETSREKSIEISVDGNPWKKLYLDWTSGIPTRVEYVGGHTEQRFQDYAEFAGHQFPRVLAEFNSNKPTMEVRVTQLDPANPQDSVFVHADGAGWMHWCSNPVPAKLTAMDQGFALPPSIPSSLWRRPFIVDGIIGTDGQWQNLVIVKSADKEVDALWLAVLRRQRYLPARCGSTPIEEERVQELRLR